jgi:hypothetical protein
MKILLIALAAICVAFGFDGTTGGTPQTAAPACATVHDGLNHPCDSHGTLYNPRQWRITDKQGLDHDCWRLVMTLANPGPDDPDESTFTDCNDQTTYDHYRIGDTYWAPDSMVMLRG